MTHRFKKSGLRAALILISGLSCTAMAQADSDYPKQRPIQLIVPFPAGSVTDAQIRAIASEAEPVSQAESLRL